MPRTRIIYQSEGVFVGQKTPCTGFNYATADIKEVYRVQNANYSFNLGRRDVLQFGELAPIDRVTIDPPTVSLDFTYLLANVYNERQMGLNVSSAGLATTNLFTGIFGGTTDQRAWWVKTVSYGTDLHGLPHSGTSATPFGVIGFGNGYISSYTVDAAVGDFPRASVRIDAANIKFDNWTGTPSGFAGHISPCIDQANGTLTSDTYLLPSGTSHTSAVDQTTVLRPGDVLFNWDSMATGLMGVAITDAKIQSFTLSADIARTPQQKLGSKFPFSYEVNFPVNCTLRITANVGDMNTGSLTALVNDTGRSTIQVRILAPTGGQVNFGFDLKGAQLDSQEYTSSIGDNKSVTLTWTTPIGGSNDTIRGIFMSGLV